MSGDASTSLLQPGSRLGSCELLCVLARGGTSVIWLARNQGLGGFEKLVAVKTIQPEHAGDAKAQRLLIEEARIAAELQDPHVVHVLDLGLLGDIGYIVMELIDGESLRALLHALQKRKKLMPIPIALRIAADICAGLAAAHGLARSDGRPNGIVHRDVSPENVLLTTAGKACLIDFGFAIEQDSEASLVGTVGKPGFIAPEVVEGAVADARSDLWSAGSILYTLLAGRGPYAAKKKPLAALNALLTGEPIPPLPNEVPEPVRGIVAQALQHDPANRFTRAVAMRKALETAGASTCGIAPSADVATFVERILADRIAARRKAMERALQEAERREKVFASLMAPPEILPAGEQMTPWRQSEARVRAAESAALASTKGDEISTREEPETLLKQPRKLTLRPEPDAFAMAIAPDTIRDPQPRGAASSPKPTDDALAVAPATAPAVMPPIPKLAPPPSSSRFRAADLLAATAPGAASDRKAPKSGPPSSADVETVPLAPPLVVPPRDAGEAPPSLLVSPAEGAPAAPPPPALVAPTPEPPPPAANGGASMRLEGRIGDRTLPLISSAPPLASAAPLAPPPPFDGSLAPAPPLDGSLAPAPPTAMTADATHPPHASAPAPTTIEPPHDESKRTPMLFALPGVLALVAIAVVVVMRTRTGPEKDVRATTDTASVARTATPPPAPSAPSSATQAASPDTASATASVPVPPPTTAAASSSAHPPGSASAKPKRPHKKPAPSATASVAPPPAPPAPEEGAP